MADAAAGRLTIRDLRSGRNNVDPPQSLKDTQCIEALNVDWFNATFARKRNGVASVSLTSSPFTGVISSQVRHIPATDETAAELWASDDAGTPNIGRLTGGTAWATPTLKDVPTGNGWDFTYASLNGKLFIAYKSAVDRLHCWDPVSNSVRRTGLAAMAVPTAADTGSGSYAAVLRYYRTRATEQRSSVTVRRSEPSPSVSFTPSGSGASARVTHGTLPGEVETHWEVEASLDNVTFYRIATVVIATATYDDSAATTSYSSNPLSATSGTYTLQKSYKFIASDQGRILGFGAYTTTDPQARVEYSAVLGSSDVGDDERVPTGNYQGLDDNDSGFATALYGPVNGSFFAGKDRQFWKLTPTGSPAIPYSVFPISKIVGVLGPQAIKVCEDESGRPNVIWMSRLGPYRLGIFGPEYIGKGVEDKTIGANGGSTLSLAATHVVCHLQWYREKRQAWFWCAVDGGNDPTIVLCFTLGRTPPPYGSNDAGVNSGWSVFTGGVATARCSVQFSNTIAASMSRDLKPYIGSTAGNNTFGKCDTGTQDLGASYQAYVDTKVYEPWGDNYTGSIQGGQIVGLVASGVTLTVTTNADFSAQTAADTVDFTQQGTETRAQPRIGGGVTIAEIQVVQWRVGDSAAMNNNWQVDELGMSWMRGALVAA